MMPLLCFFLTLFASLFKSKTDHTLISDGRFRGEADVDDHAASTASVADDPKRT
jgi:hypothetical protein